MLKPLWPYLARFLCLSTLWLFAGNGFAAPQRIVSLAPHLTEAIFWLGAENRLIGRDRFSNYPAASQKIPVVGDAYNVNVEALLASQPDLILLWQPPKSLQHQLAKQGLPLFVTNPVGLSAIYSELKRLAAILDISAANKFADLLASIKQLEQRALANNAPKALLLVQAQPPITLGLGDSLASSLPYCGWQNALSQKQAVVSISPEYLLAGDYQALLLFNQKKTPPVKAVPQLVINADALVRPGPRFPAALQGLCQQLAQLTLN